jgi:hypothetical protein
MNYLKLVCAIGLLVATLVMTVAVTGCSGSSGTGGRSAPAKNPDSSHGME